MSRKESYEIMGKQVHCYDLDLLECCNTLHTNSTGSSEGDCEDNRIKYLFLLERLADWQPFSGQSWTETEVVIRYLCHVECRQYEQSWRFEMDRKYCEGLAAKKAAEATP